MSYGNKAAFTGFVMRRVGLAGLAMALIAGGAMAQTHSTKTGHKKTIVRTQNAGKIDAKTQAEIQKAVAEAMKEASEATREAKAEVARAMKEVNVEMAGMNREINE
ncbi:MAG TPA: hypothetical protein VG944_22580, partial [Fimbriimonas sp.]|nr:hypothetical protein [Fimbriimonas sp.]